MKTTSTFAVASAVATLFATVALAGDKEGAKKDVKAETTVSCEGVNACKAKGACSGADHGCAGQNSCKGKGWVTISEKECKAKGGKIIASAK